jgi:hypothetical protein
MTVWSVNGITLASGTNVLTVTARDAAGNSSTDTLTVTYTAPPVDVPNVVGQPQATAEAAIVAASLVASTTTAYDAAVPAGNVISQNPSGGVSVPVGSTVNLVVSLGRVNAPPTIQNPGNRQGTLNQPTSLQIVASDPDANDTLTFSATGLPTGLAIGPSNGLISGVPTKNGTFSVTVRVVDSLGASASVVFSWSISRKATSQAPSIVTPPGQSGVVGQSASLQISATDPNGSALTYSASGLPTGLTINSQTGLISGTYQTTGTWNAAVTVANSNGDSASATFSWTVTLTANSPPVVTNPGPQDRLNGDTVSLQIQATDADSDALRYSANTLPAGLAINATGLISGKLTSNGKTTTTVTVNDGRGGVTSVTFTWTIRRR